jgi:hypothetical protein
MVITYDAEPPLTSTNRSKQREMIISRVYSLSATPPQHLSLVAAVTTTTDNEMNERMDLVMERESHRCYQFGHDSIPQEESEAIRKWQGVWDIVFVSSYYGRDHLFANDHPPHHYWSQHSLAQRPRWGYISLSWLPSSPTTLHSIYRREPILNDVKEMDDWIVPNRLNNRPYWEDELSLAITHGNGQHGQASGIILPSTLISILFEYFDD